MFRISDTAKIETCLPVHEVEHVDFTSMIAPPKADVSNTSGTSLFAQYLESILYRTTGFVEIDQNNIGNLHKTAISLDSEDEKCEVPSVEAIVDATSLLGYVKYFDTTYFADMDTFLWRLATSGPVLVELKATDTTLNAHDFDIMSKGETMSDEFSKGFIACAYDGNSVILQNSLGTDCGVLGFNRIKTDIFKSLFLRGMCFRNLRGE